MSETKSPATDAPAADTLADTRAAIAQAEAGNGAAIESLDQAGHADRASVDAAQQELADGPAGRGLAR